MIFVPSRAIRRVPPSRWKQRGAWDIAYRPPVVEQATLASDWLARSTAPGVVWAHDFLTAAEVNNFRISGGIGNDPNNTGGTDCIWVSSGITGGALQFTVPGDGVTTSHGYWGRPFSALTATGNGKSVNDRADGGAAPRAWNPNNVNQLGEWGAGYITHPDYYNHASRGNGVNGFELEQNYNEFYIQMRFRHSSGRFTGGTPDGKLCMLMITGDGPVVGTGQPRTPNQEIVFKSEPGGQCYFYTNFGSRSNSFMHATQGNGGGGTTPQPGGECAGTCGFRAGGAFNGSTPCTTYDASGWWTALHYVKPGHDGGNGDNPIMAGNTANDTIVKSWIAGPGETSYRKWHDKSDYVMSFGENDPWPYGYNALILSAFMNDVPSNTGWTIRYGQLIHSRQFINCPQV